MKKRREASVLRYMLLRRLVPTLVLLFSFLLFFCLLLSMMIRHNAQTQTAYQKERMEQAALRLEDELLRIDYSQREVVNAQTFQQFVYMYDDIDWYTRYTLQNGIHRELRRLQIGNNLVTDVYLYIPSLDISISDARATASLPDWCRDCLAEDLIGLGETLDTVVNSVVSWETPEENEKTAILLVSLNKDAMLKSVASVYSTDEDSLSIRFGRNVADDEQDNALTVYAQTLPFFLRYVRGTSSQDTFVLRVVLLSVAFVGIVLLVEIIGLALWFKQVYLPLDTLLIDAFAHMEQGDLKHRISLGTASAFDSVYASYNHMMEKMEAYVESNLRQQILVSNANFKQLQAQINPHFMYNSYYILYRLIKKGDMESSLALAEHLGHFYRYITRNAGDEKRLSEEVEHARTYATIQQFRFREMLHVDIAQPPEGIAQTYVPRLIIQPILENAFKYAYESAADGTMKLCVSYDVRGERSFDIVVENSGEIQDETIDAIRENLACKDVDIETTALVNIHRRLRIYFGDESGLTLSRSELGGLCVRMRIEDEREV